MRRDSPVRFCHRSYVKRAKRSGFYASSVKRGGVVVAVVEADGTVRS
jgi:RNase P/RNase MRP subunit POP5